MADRRIEEAIEKALIMIGGIVESAAKENLTASGAVDTGLLRNSITYALGGEYPATQQYQTNQGGKTKSGADVEEKTGTYTEPAPADESGTRTVYVGTNVEYAPYIELGTSKMSARPYLRPAFENNRDKIQRAFAAAVRGL